jgi:hypothetical protein
MGRHASAFEEKPNNPYKQGQKQTLTSRRIFTETKSIPFHEICDASAGPKYFLQKLRSKMSRSTPSHLSLISLESFLEGVNRQ